MSTDNPITRTSRSVVPLTPASTNASSTTSVPLVVHRPAPWPAAALAAAAPHLASTSAVAGHEPRTSPHTSSPNSGGTSPWALGAPQEPARSPRGVGLLHDGTEVRPSAKRLKEEADRYKSNKDSENAEAYYEMAVKAFNQIGDTESANECIRERAYCFKRMAAKSDRDMRIEQAADQYATAASLFDTLASAETAPASVREGGGTQFNPAAVRDACILAEANCLVKRVRSLTLHGRLSDAEELHPRVGELFTKIQKDEDLAKYLRTRLDSYMRTSRLRMNQQKHKEAYRLGKQALTHLEELKEKSGSTDLDSEFATCLRLQAKCAEAMAVKLKKDKNYEEAMALYREALDGFVACKDTTAMERCQEMLSDCAFKFIKAASPHCKIYDLDPVLQACHLVDPPQKRELAALWQANGTFYYKHYLDRGLTNSEIKSKCGQMALKLFREAIEVYDSTEVKAHRDETAYGYLLSDAAGLCVEFQQFEDAVRYYEEAAKVYAKDSVTHFQREARSYVKLAELFEESDSRKALKYLHKAQHAAEKSKDHRTQELVRIKLTSLERHAVRKSFNSNLLGTRRS